MSAVPSFHAAQAPNAYQHFQPQMGFLPASGAPLAGGMGGLPPGPAYEAEKSTLFVGNLSPEVDNNYLFQIFFQYGRITSFRVMRDMYTGESREFGFVTFLRMEDAARAFEDLNGSEVLGRELRVMFKRRIRDLDENANLMVKNIDPKLKTRQLLEQCKSCGTVLSLLVLHDKIERPDSVGCGYVQFENVEDANKFVELYNGKLLCDKELQVEPYIPARLRAKPEAKNLYIKNFPAGWDQERVQKFINEELWALGKILCKGVYPKHSSFYAFVAYENAEDAKAAIEKYRGWKESPDAAEGLYIDLAQNKKARAKHLADEKMLKKNETNLYLRSLRAEVTVEELTAVFEKYGKVTSVLLKPWENPQPGEVPTDKKMQFGFINFERSEDAIKAHSACKTDTELRAMIDASETRDFLFFAQSKRIREQYLRVQRAQYMMLMNIRTHQMMMGMMPARGQGGPRGKPKRQQHYAPPAMNLLPPTTAVLPSIGSRTPTPQKEPAPQTPVQLIEQATDLATFVALLKKHQKQFEALEPEKQKKLFGQWMYGQVDKACKEKHLIPKITGMLIDPDVLDFDEKMEILGDESLLKERVAEAEEILGNSK